MIFNNFVHQGLRKEWLVSFIMPVTSEADDFDNHVATEFLAEIEGKDGGLQQCFRVITVNVKDRRHQHFCNVGRITGRTRVGRQRGEADLVVDHHVQGATGSVTFESRKVQRFRYHALSGKGGITVYQQRQNLFGSIRTNLILARTTLAFDDRVDGLKMTRI